MAEISAPGLSIGLSIDIVLAKLGTRYFAITMLGDINFRSDTSTDPILAVQSLLMKLADTTKDGPIAITMALEGTGIKSFFSTQKALMAENGEGNDSRPSD